jgi:selenide,water dikinase
MTAENEVGAVIESAVVPLFAHVCDYAAMGLIPAGAYQNRESRARFVTGFDQLDETMGFVLFDPQTSGGLLASVPRHLAASLLSALHDRGVTGAVVGYTDEKLSGLHVR